MKVSKLTKALSIFLVIFCLHTKAQVTTSTINGTVLTLDGKALSGATVRIAFEDAGINKATITKSDGSYLVPNLRVGGPYKVTVSFTGFREKTEDNIQLELGQNTAVDFKLEPAAVSLEAVTVSGRSKIFDNQR